MTNTQFKQQMIIKPQKIIFKAQNKIKTQILSVIIMSAVLGACGRSEKSNDLTVHTSSSSTDEALGTSKFDVNRFPLNKLVCDPLTGQANNATDSNLGLKAKLYTVPNGTIYKKVDDFFTHGTLSSQNLFFTDMNVPTRMFTEGFNNSLTNSAVKDDSGQKLIEYFAIRFSSNLKLPLNFEEGDYELAILSDDGAQVKLKIDNQWNLVVDNDGDHSTRMGCSKQLIHMTRDTVIPIEISYYQGPRYHISSVLMWRKSTSAGNDPQCGQNGNSMYFDPNNNSNPQLAYQNLLARNWSVVPAESFVLESESSGDFNPCVVGTPPKISDFVVYEYLSFDLIVGWKTDIPATSQVRIIEKETGFEVLTSSDNLLKTNHNITISGLKPNTTYLLQAVSVSADLGKTFSVQLTETTLPV